MKMIKSHEWRFDFDCSDKFLVQNQLNSINSYYYYSVANVELFMDLNSFRRRSSPSNSTDQRFLDLGRPPSKRFWFSTMKLNRILAACLTVLPLLITLCLIFRHQPSDQVIAFADARVLDSQPQLNISTTVNAGEKNSFH